MVSFLPPDAFASNSSQELDVARALLQFPLGASATATTEEMTRETRSVPASDANKGPAKAASHGFTLSLYTITEKVTSTDQGPSQGEPPLVRRPRSGSEGLDCLAALAERESHIPAPMDVSSTTLGSSSSEDDATMPPPKPIARPRSVSNPEDIMVGPPVRRPFFILPQAILEQELAQARRATSRSPPSIPEDSLYEENPAQEEEQEELSPEDLLRRARSRLLEDLSECAIHGDKNMLLPHSLSKYKNVRFVSCAGHCRPFSRPQIMFNTVSHHDMSIQILTRSTARTGALASTRPTNEPPFWLDSITSEAIAIGKRAFGTGVEKIWPTVVSASRDAL